MMNHYYNGKRLPEYYDTMYLDGYSGDEVYVAFHRSLQKKVSEMQQKQQLENQIEKELEQQIEEKLEKSWGTFLFNSRRTLFLNSSL